MKTGDFAFNVETSSDQLATAHALPTKLAEEPTASLLDKDTGDEIHKGAVH